VAVFCSWKFSQERRIFFSSRRCNSRLRWSSNCYFRDVGWDPFMSDQLGFSFIRPPSRLHSRGVFEGASAFQGGEPPPRPAAFPHVFFPQGIGLSRNKAVVEEVSFRWHCYHQRAFFLMRPPCLVSTWAPLQDTEAPFRVISRAATETFALKAPRSSFLSEPSQVPFFWVSWVLPSRVLEKLFLPAAAPFGLGQSS